MPTLTMKDTPVPPRAQKKPGLKTKSAAAPTSRRKHAATRTVYVVDPQWKSKSLGMRQAEPQHNAVRP